MKLPKVGEVWEWVFPLYYLEGANHLLYISKIENNLFGCYVLEDGYFHKELIWMNERYFIRRIREAE